MFILPYFQLNMFFVKILILCLLTITGYTMESSRPITKAAKTLPLVVRDNLLQYLKIKDLAKHKATKGLQGEPTGVGCHCLIIEEKGPHREMIEKVIGCIAPLTAIHRASTSDPYDYILKEVEHFSKTQKRPLIVNFSGDVSTSCRFITSQNDFFYALDDWKNNNDITFEDLKGMLEEKFDPLSVSILNRIKNPLNIQDRNQVSEDIKGYAAQEEFKEKLAFSQKAQREFYRHVAQSPALFVFSMGNRYAKSMEVVHRIFSPLRASFTNEDFLDHTILVVNVTDQNTLEENSEIPSNDGRGDYPIGIDNKPIFEINRRGRNPGSYWTQPGYIKSYNKLSNPLSPLDDSMLLKLQKATIAVRGQWYTEDENNMVHGTSAAAAVVSGTLVLIQQCFPQLTKEQLREAALYSAIRQFSVPLEAISENQKVLLLNRRFREGNLKEGSTQINLDLNRYDDSSFYGQGMFDTLRAFQYAYELSIPRRYGTLFYECKNADERRDKFNKNYKNK